jgi:hypothetical protein
VSLKDKRDRAVVRGKVSLLKIFVYLFKMKKDLNMYSWKEPVEREKLKTEDKCVR